MADRAETADITKFANCWLLYGNELIFDSLWVRNGVILNPRTVYWDERVTADVVVDCKGAILCPGYIDLQVNGGFGVDFSSPDDIQEDAVSKVSRGLLQFGVTSFCPTLISCKRDCYQKIVPKVKHRSGGCHGAEVLGLHLEGPFISREKHGAHLANNIVPLSNGFQSLLEMYGSLDDVRIITLAPELQHVNETIAELTKMGIVSSLGHSAGNLVDGEKSISAGARFITHLFNAMLPFHHRDPGLVGLLTSKHIPANQTVYFGIIADGIHTHPAALRIAHRTHPKGLVLVTDAVAPMGLLSGVHHVGDQLIEIKEGKKAFIAGTNTLCGSIATMDACVRNFYKQVGMFQKDRL